MTDSTSAAGATVRDGPALAPHRLLLSDRVSQEAFRRALLATVRAGQTVVDIGTGTGIHAMFACQAGAAKVYAIDNHTVINTARRVCQDNGFADRITFICEPAERVVLPEPADVVCVHMGLADTVAVLRSTRGRFVFEGTTIIPARFQIMCAPLETSQEEIAFWERPQFGFSFTAMSELAKRSAYTRRVASAEVLANEMCWAEVELATMRDSLISGTVGTTIARNGVCNGIGIWYVEYLAAGFSISTRPPCDLPVAFWPHTVLPIDPVGVTVGDLFQCSIRKDISSERSRWAWKTAVKSTRHSVMCDRGYGESEGE